MSINDNFATTTYYYPGTITSSGTLGWLGSFCNRCGSYYTGNHSCSHVCAHSGCFTVRTEPAHEHDFTESVQQDALFCRTCGETRVWNGSKFAKRVKSNG